MKITRQKAGFSTLLFIFLLFFFLLGLGFAGDYLYIAYTKSQNIYPTPTPVPGQTLTPVSATGSFQKDKYSVSITMNFPEEGGGVTGSFSGDCSGNIQGVYEGKESGKIMGKAVGSCDPFFVPVPASAEFEGMVNSDTKIVLINGTGSAMGFSGSGNVTLSY